MHTSELLDKALYPLVFVLLLGPVPLACDSGGTGDAGSGSSSGANDDDDDDADDDDGSATSDDDTSSDPDTGISTTMGSDGTGSAESTTGSSSDPSAPQILSFSVNSTSITELDSLVFSAVVTDPDGIDDLIGGTLQSSGGGSYGAFQTASSEGAYELTLSWQDIRTVEDIDAEGSRSFVAEFFDQAGNTVTDTVQVELSCSVGTDLCGPGSCDPIDTLEHCGSCDNDCVDLDAPPALINDSDVDPWSESMWTNNDDWLWCERDTSCNISVRLRQFADFTCATACSPWEAVEAVVWFDKTPVSVDAQPIQGPHICLCEQP